MRALTITNPWAVFIMLGFKRIENRDWLPPSSLLKLGERFAIHAGKKSVKAAEMEEIIDELSDRDFPISQLPEVEELLELQKQTAGRVVATAVWSDWHSIRRTVPLDQKPWWVGTYGLELAQVERCWSEPIKGMLGLWALPVDFKLGVAP